MVKPLCAKVKETNDFASRITADIHYLDESDIMSCDICDNVCHDLQNKCNV